MRIRRILGKIRRKFIIRVKEVTRPYVINLQKEGRFAGQVAVVTGGSGVIGRAICYRLAAEGAKVYVCGTNADRLKAVTDEITAAGLKAVSLQFNLTDEQSIVDAFKTVHDAEGKIDTLVCCAGGGARDESASIVKQTAAVIRRVIDINLMALIFCTREAARYMAPARRGCIIEIASTVGVCGMPNYSEYAAAKAGSMAFVKSMAMELGKNGIRMNCVTPGIVQRGEIDENMMEHINRTNWLNSYGKPEDIAAMVAYVNSEEASFITGQNYVVDGGRSLGLKE